MDLKNKKICVLGLGTSGFSVARQLSEMGAEVFVSELSDDKNIKEIIQKLPKNIKYELGRHSYEFVSKCDLVIKSPGIPPHANIIKELIKNKKEVIDEIELAYRLLRYKKLIAVTGTNGKSTTVLLIGEILKNQGYKTIVCGNIGEPISSFINISDENTYLVAEASSFQLLFTKEFKPDISCILNITFDHLDYHGTFTEYVNAKAKIFANQTQDDFCVLNDDDENVKNLFERAKAKKLLFSKYKNQNVNAWIENNKIYIKTNGNIKSLQLNTSLVGEHNIENILASALISDICEVDPQIIETTIRNFKGLKHRIEYVSEINGVKFYNDSKSTNPACVMAAIKSFNAPIHLIMGGKDKQLDYSGLKGIIKERVKSLHLIGETANRLSKEFNGLTDIYVCDNLETAVRNAFACAKKDEIVLLSPGCSSFDQFKNFEERGKKFKDIVLQL